MTILNDKSSRPWFDIETLGIAAILFAVGIVSRIPFRSSVLYHWDSVNFALALDHFDVRLHQPHPPGTFIIYIMLGRLANWLLHDPNASLVWISILASGLSAAFIFVLVQGWFGKRIGLIVAALMLSSPLIWFHGEVALSYMPEFFWVLALALSCSRAYKGSKKALFTSAFLLGLAGGIRPNTPVFMFPLWVFSVRKFPIREIAISLIVMAFGVALWVVPMVIMSGGPAAYWEIIQGWRGSHMEESGNLGVMAIYVARLGAFTLYCLGIGVIPVIWAILRYWRDWKHLLVKDQRVQTLVLWIAPGLAYFVLIHIRQPGHTFTIMPAFIIVTGVAIAVISRNWADDARRVWIIMTILVVGCNSVFFLLGPPNLFGSSRSILSMPTWASIREYDMDVTQRLKAIREMFRPEETVVLAGSRNHRLPDFYLRDFQLPSLSHYLGDDVDFIALPEHVHTLVLFDDSMLPQISVDSHLRSLPLPGGRSVRYVTWDEGQRVTLSQTELEIQDE